MEHRPPTPIRKGYRRRRRAEQRAIAGAEPRDRILVQRHFADRFQDGGVDAGDGALGFGIEGANRLNRSRKNRDATAVPARERRECRRARRTRRAPSPSACGRSRGGSEPDHRLERERRPVERQHGAGKRGTRRQSLEGGGAVVKITRGAAPGSHRQARQGVDPAADHARVRETRSKGRQSGGQFSRSTSGATKAIASAWRASAASSRATNNRARGARDRPTPGRRALRRAGEQPPAGRFKGLTRTATTSGPWRRISHRQRIVIEPGGRGALGRDQSTGRCRIDRAVPESVQLACGQLPSGVQRTGRAAGPIPRCRAR